jgi:integration host factor subunit beta
MIKSELIARVVGQSPHLFARDVDKTVNALFDEIVAALARGDRVEMRGFGIFFVRTWSPRPGRNPKTGEGINVPETNHVAFRTGREMHARLNGILEGAPRAAFHKP